MQRLLLTVVLLATAILGKKPKELQIERQELDKPFYLNYIPEDCYDRSSVGDEILVHYTGKLETGQIFDSSLQRQEPIAVKLGEGKVIQGWEQGLLDMCVGERRVLLIPPHLGYGSNGSPPTIPPEATLMFETELVAINRESVDQKLMRLLQFLVYPGIIGVIIYYLYQKYQSESDSHKQEKAGNKSKKSKRR